MKLKGQGKINICGFEYKKNIADSRRGGGVRRGGGGGPSTPKKLYPRLLHRPSVHLVWALCPKCPVSNAPVLQS